MGFNKDLFFELCKEYNVEFSKEYTEPMLLENGQVRKLADLTEDDLYRIFFTKMNKLNENLDRLNAIANFKDDWNGYGASRFSNELINKARNILLNLNEQPDLFPTAQPSIQLEYEPNDKNYLEFNILEDKIIAMQILQEDYDNAKFWDLSCNDTEQINKIVNQFLNMSV